MEFVASNHARRTCSHGHRSIFTEVATCNNGPSCLIHAIRWTAPRRRPRLQTSWRRASGRTADLQEADRCAPAQSQQGQQSVAAAHPAGTGQLQGESRTLAYRQGPRGTGAPGTRRREGRVVLDKLRRETGRGKTESSTYGLANVAGHQVVLYAMNWDFFAGSLGVVSGEAFQAAADLAISKRLPFVSVYASSGVRQHENFAGLTQMTRMWSRSATTSSGSPAPGRGAARNVWGGVSASAVPTPI